MFKTTSGKGRVFIREGVIYVLWNGTETSAEAWEAESMENDCSMRDLDEILKAIEHLRGVLEGEDA